MQMHDWTRVVPNHFHAFHHAWVAVFQQHLNTGGLPPGYYALAEQVTPPFAPDVLALQSPTPDPGANGSVPHFPADQGGVALAVAPPRVRFAAVGVKPDSLARPRLRVAIRYNGTNRLVAVIEILSPANKAGRRKFEQFVETAVGLLDQGVHLLLIDPFPPTARDPHGIHDAVWRLLVRERFTPPADKPLTPASYAADPPEQYRAFVEPLAVGDAIPVMPLFLTPAVYVNVPLGETYRQAWAGFPKHLQAEVEGR